MEFLEAVASIRASNDVPFFHAHRGVTTAQLQGRFGFIRTSNRSSRRNSTVACPLITKSIKLSLVFFYYY